MPENVFCSKCGTQNASTAANCQNCGVSLWPAPAANQVAAGVARGYAPQQPVVYAQAPASPYGGFWIRVVAQIIDQIIVGIVIVPLYAILVFPSIIRIINEAERNSEPSPEMIISIVSSAAVFIVVVFVGLWLYDALLTTSSWQGTVGKRILRLKVTDEAGYPIGFGRATGRFVGKILSRLLLCIGFIMVAFTDRKRGLHDMLAGTLVMKY
ncbi:MAG TPA: RDD family protein [Candidatus Angelobacter sp.]|nr:RDD family protein [Candidatus Angelobacter sp.]